MSDYTERMSKYTEKLQQRYYRAIRLWREAVQNRPPGES